MRPQLHRNLLWLALALASASPAQEFTAFGLARLGAQGSQSPRSWLEGGNGRYASGDGTEVDAVGHLGLMYEPSLEWHFFGHALVRADGGAGDALGLVEAYAERFFFGENDQMLRLRLGQFFLPTSREAVDPLWQSRYLLSLSTLNSWIAEESRPIGLDVSWRNALDAEHEFELAATAWVGNDSNGALLAWRGFAQHDRLSTLGEALPLPDLPSLGQDGAFSEQRDDGSRPFGPDLDGRVGYGLRARYGKPEQFRVLASLSDNRGDRELHRGEYAWATRFTTVGAEWQPGPRWMLAGEWMHGRSGMGQLSATHVDIDFDNAYLLLSFAPDTQWRFSARVEQFDIDDRDGTAEDNSERGSGFSIAALREFGSAWRLGLELGALSGTRPAAALVDGDASPGGRYWRAELRRSF